MSISDAAATFISLTYAAVPSLFCNPFTSAPVLTKLSVTATAPNAAALAIVNASESAEVIISPSLFALTATTAAADSVALSSLSSVTCSNTASTFLYTTPVADTPESVPPASPADTVPPNAKPYNPELSSAWTVSCFSAFPLSSTFVLRMRATFSCRLESDTPILLVATMPPTLTVFANDTSPATAFWLVLSSVVTEMLPRFSMLLSCVCVLSISARRCFVPVFTATLPCKAPPFSASPTAAPRATAHSSLSLWACTFRFFDCVSVFPANSASVLPETSLAAAISPTAKFPRVISACPATLTRTSSVTACTSFCPMVSELSVTTALVWLDNADTPTSAPPVTLTLSLPSCASTVIAPTTCTRVPGFSSIAFESYTVSVTLPDASTEPVLVTGNFISSPATTLFPSIAKLMLPAVPALSSLSGSAPKSAALPARSALPWPVTSTKSARFSKYAFAGSGSCTFTSSSVFLTEPTPAYTCRLSASIVDPMTPASKVSWIRFSTTAAFPSK